MTRKLWISILLFASIPILSVLYLFSWAPSGIDANGYPNWMIGFICIEMLYCGFMWWFIKTVWK